MSDYGLKKIKEVTTNESGIYFIYNKDKELMYIGKAVSIRLRLLQHIHITWGDVNVLHNYFYADYILISSEQEREKAETRLINMLKPPLNRDKVYSYESSYYNKKYHKKTFIQEKLDKEFQEKFDESMKSFFL